MDKDLRRLIDGIATDLGVSLAARQKWWQRDGVPPKWRKAILDEARQRGRSLKWDDLGGPASREAA